MKNNESQPNRDGTLRVSRVITTPKNHRPPVIQSERVKSESLRGGKVYQLLVNLEKNNKKQHPRGEHFPALLHLSCKHCIFVSVRIK